MQKTHAKIGWMMSIALAAAAACFPAGARADSLELDILPNNVAAAPGSTGSFDVILDNLSESPVDVAGFNVELAVAPGSGVTFTNVTDTGTDPGANYIFTSPSLTFAGYGVNNPGFPDTDIVANDVDFAGPYQTIDNGSAVGLARVYYSVSGSASGTIPMTFDLTPTGCSVVDGDGDPIPFNAVNGSITVSGPAVVPLPASAASGLSLLALLAAGSAISYRCRNKPSSAE